MWEDWSRKIKLVNEDENEGDEDVDDLESDHNDERKHPGIVITATPPETKEAAEGEANQADKDAIAKNNNNQIKPVVYNGTRKNYSTDHNRSENGAKKKIDGRSQKFPPWPNDLPKTNKHKDNVIKFCLITPVGSLQSPYWNPDLVPIIARCHSVDDAAIVKPHEPCFPPRPFLAPDPDVILLCYSCCDIDSFMDSEKDIYEDLVKRFPDTPIILVGTKSDLRDSEPEVVSLVDRNLLISQTRAAQDITRG